MLGYKKFFRAQQQPDARQGARILEQEEEESSTRTRSLQRPRVFYRRETEALPLVIARP